MNPAFTIASCNPDDTVFSEVFSRIYSAEYMAQSPNEIDRDYLVKCLAVRKGDDVLGRMAIYQNQAHTHLQKPVIQFGNFECINDSAAAKALLEAGLDLARDLGASFVTGPMNGSTWNQYRFISARGDEPLFFTEQNTLPYYPALWKEAGFVPFQEYLSNKASIPAALSGSTAFLTAHGLSARSIDIDNLRKELELLYPLCSAAFSKAPFYSPVSMEKFVTKMMALKSFIAPSLTKIIFDPSGAPAAFILCLPDIRDKSAKTLILKTAAKHPDCNVPGLMSELYKVIMQDAYGAGFRQVIHAFMHVDNTSLKRSHQLDGKPIRQYTLYIQPCL